MSLAVIGAGFGRTGTNSLKLALEQLGLGPCYHMFEVARNPGHAALWDAAADGEPVDWDALFAGYRSAVDWPVARFWRELAERYPEARVILTVRDPVSWHASAMRTIHRAMTSPLADDPERARHRLMARKVVIEQTFGGRMDDPEHAMDVFRRHNAEVIRTVPRSRLLAFDVAEGWEPLCRFLGVAVPDAPFPVSNTTEEFRDRVVPGGPAGTEPPGEGDAEPGART